MMRMPPAHAKQSTVASLRATPLAPLKRLGGRKVTLPHAAYVAGRIRTGLERQSVDSRGVVAGIRAHNCHTGRARSRLENPAREERLGRPRHDRTPRAVLPRKSLVVDRPQPVQVIQPQPKQRRRLRPSRRMLRSTARCAPSSMWDILNVCAARAHPGHQPHDREGKIIGPAPYVGRLAAAAWHVSRVTAQG